MRHLERRLKRLEAQAGAEQPCPQCGQWPLHLVNALEIEWYDDPDEQPAEEPTICPACGQANFTVIRWVDLDESWESDED